MFMPQLDSITFFNQIFYFLLTFTFLFIFLAKKGLPTLAATFKARSFFLNVFLSKPVPKSDSSQFDALLVAPVNELVSISKKFINVVEKSLKKSYKQLSFFLFYNNKLKNLHNLFVVKRLSLKQFSYVKKMRKKRSSLKKISSLKEGIGKEVLHVNAFSLK